MTIQWLILKIVHENCEKLTTDITDNASQLIQAVLLKAQLPVAGSCHGCPFWQQDLSLEDLVKTYAQNLSPALFYKAFIGYILTAYFLRVQHRGK